MTPCGLSPSWIHLPPDETTNLHRHQPTLEHELNVMLCCGVCVCVCVLWVVLFNGHIETSEQTYTQVNKRFIFRLMNLSHEQWAQLGNFASLDFDMWTSINPIAILSNYINSHTTNNDTLGESALPGAESPGHPQAAGLPELRQISINRWIIPTLD